MMDKAMLIDNFISELDTNRFGFNVAKLNESDFVFDPKTMIESFKDNGVKLVMAKVNANDVDLINNLEGMGFGLKDIQVTYKYDLLNYEITKYNNANVIIRDAAKYDCHSLEEIALESFDSYGHYAADKRIPAEVCKEIYRDWILRSLDNPNIADKVIVAECDGEIAGFLSFKTHLNGSEYAAGGLGAVSPKFRNKDIFRMISLGGLNWGKQIGLEWEEHNVLITNLPVNRSFSKLGFKICNSFITMHLWID